ncbi:putative Pre-mRNA-splicing factor ISY1 like protein [Blattamonas nauphoetae]|uniref:Pre-mRNA-splicing factor ISY1 like protein n=1 Tax=Blattamonas nauphoetae TaxID=2049346 RepID=A0ABQ9YMN0_9EUKA|nr:putative Pre-mRNA-splicing factor ISY1 like protein [Blattamonas nauphoetae]
MARNEEKAHAMLNRYWAQVADERRQLQPEVRPFDINECSDLARAQHWRQQVVTDLDEKTTLIQNESLGEHKLRDLNDTINRLLLERWKWEKRIFELGGPNLMRSQTPPEYQYFGATKMIPSIREVISKQAPDTRKKTRKELLRNVDYEYYGFCDESPELLEAERRAEIEVW